MKTLVIPDVHLKPWMFERAATLMREGCAERAVCLMDIADDWMQQYNIDLYIETYDASIRFAEDFPDTLWCYGNHDLSYEWKHWESGYSPMAEATVCLKLWKLREVLREEGQIAYLHRIDDVLFSHGGLSEAFVRYYVPEEFRDDTDAVIDTINGLDQTVVWRDESPIWCRPQLEDTTMYRAENLLQVVGHTPVKAILREGQLISCDVFSTYSDGRPIGTQEFLVLDTQTWEYVGVK